MCNAPFIHSLLTCPLDDYRLPHVINSEKDQRELKIKPLSPECCKKKDLTNGVGRTSLI